MVKMLDTNDYCVCEFVEIFKMSQPAISQHLRKLKDQDWYKKQKEDNGSFTHLNRESEYYPLIHRLTATSFLTKILN